MKVIHISRKKKITRTSYDWYRAKNKIKSFYHKIGAFAFSLCLALLMGSIASMCALSAGADPIIWGWVASFISFSASILSAFGKLTLPFGLLSVLTFNCNYGLSNTGTDCTPTFTAAKKLLLMSYYNAAGGQNRFALSNPGTIGCIQASTTLTGTGTHFTTTFTVGDIILIHGNPQVFQILAITNDTALTTTVAAVATTTTAAYNEFTNINYWNALVNHPDPTRRIYPVPFLKNADNTRADSIVEAFDDNTEQITLQGVRKFNGIIPKANASPQLQGRLLGMQNTDFGMYWVDYTNNLIGSDTGDGFFYPIRIDQNSWMPIFNPGTAKKGMKIELKFDIHQNEIDSNMNAIAASNFGTVQLGNLNGLKDVNYVFSNITALGNDLTVALTTLYGDAITPTQVHGLTVNNFISRNPANPGKQGYIYDSTTSTDHAVSSVTEGSDVNGKPNGIYTVVLTIAGAANDVLYPAISAPGYDFSNVNVSTVTLT